MWTMRSQAAIHSAINLPVNLKVWKISELTRCVDYQLHCLQLKRTVKCHNHKLLFPLHLSLATFISSNNCITTLCCLQDSWNWDWLNCQWWHWHFVRKSQKMMCQELMPEDIKKEMFHIFCNIYLYFAVAFGSPMGYSQWIFFKKSNIVLCGVRFLAVIQLKDAIIDELYCNSYGCFPHRLRSH